MPSRSIPQSAFCGNSSNIFLDLTAEDRAIACARMSRAQRHAYHDAAIYDWHMSKHHAHDLLDYGLTARDLIEIRYRVADRDKLLAHRLAIY